jgi:hypothetical protein
MPWWSYTAWEKYWSQLKGPMKRKRTCNLYQTSGKSKAIPVTGHGGPQGCEKSRFPHFLDNQLTDGGKVVSLTRRPPFAPPEDSWYSYLSRGWVDPRTIARLERLGTLKKIHLIGTRTRDLPACSIVPQPTTLPPWAIFIHLWCVSSYSNYLWVISRWRHYLEWDVWWLRKDLDGSGRGLIKVQSRNSSGDPEESHEKLRQDSVPAQSRTGYPPEYDHGAITLFQPIQCTKIKVNASRFYCVIPSSINTCSKPQRFG